MEHTPLRLEAQPQASSAPLHPKPLPGQEPDPRPVCPPNTGPGSVQHGAQQNPMDQSVCSRRLCLSAGVRGW